MRAVYRAVNFHTTSICIAQSKSNFGRLFLTQGQEIIFQFFKWHLLYTYIFHHANNVFFNHFC
jgi:hypothetical protein